MLKIWHRIHPGLRSHVPANPGSTAPLPPPGEILGAPDPSPAASASEICGDWVRGAGRLLHSDSHAPILQVAEKCRACVLAGLNAEF